MDEALSAPVLMGALREWLDTSEPRLVDTAREAWVTWAELAAVLPGPGDRRAAPKRRSRQRNIFTEGQENVVATAESATTAR
ncbi:hypothetical protein CQJ94_12650 [Glycomyces fuscus]|nr:hypothetical protein CQJ94_12650 [Glycomyces fuscus]